ncbi:MAG: ABC transporter substrate-binding protein, partial [Pseudomonadota bacterium]
LAGLTGVSSRPAKQRGARGTGDGPATVASRWIPIPLILGAALSCQGEGGIPGPIALGAGNSDPHRGGILVFAINDDVRTLDPAVAYDEFTLYAEHLIYDTLVGYAPATSPNPTALVPQLAKSWAVSTDGLRYSFSLRGDAVFWDGQPVLAGDFVYALERILTPETASPGAQFYAGIRGARARLEGKARQVTGLRALDPRTLEIELEEPDAAFPLLLAMKFATPLKQSHVEKVGDRLRDTPLGTGPFVLEEWDQGSKLVFRRNPTYHDSSIPLLDGIIMQVMVPRDVAALKFLRGELDLVERILSDDYARFAASPEWAALVIRTPGMNTFAESMNVTRPPFSSRLVRQAFNYALNKEDTIRINGGRAVPSSGILPPSMPGHDRNRLPYPHDPAKARSLLTEAGYGGGFEVVYTTTQDETAQRLAQSIQADLAEVGVRVRIRLLTFPALVTLAGRGEIDFGFTAWTMDFPDARNFIEPKFHSRSIAPENSTNDSFYANAELDRLLDLARREQDERARLALYKRIEDILYDDCPYLWHYHTVQVEIRQPYVMGYTPHPVWVRDYRHTWLDDPRQVRR